MNGTFLGCSGAPTLEVASQGFLLQRSYSSSSISRNETLTVNLTLYALADTIIRPIVEDYLPAGFAAVVSSLNSGGPVGKAMVDPASPDKVVFSLTDVEAGSSVSFEYGIRSVIPGTFSAPSALAYPSRDISNVTYTAPGAVGVLKTWKNETASTRGTMLNVGTRGEGPVFAPALGTRTQAPKANVTAYPTLELLSDPAAGSRIRGVVENKGGADAEVTAVFRYSDGTEVKKDLLAPAGSVQDVQAPQAISGSVVMEIRDGGGNVLGSSDEWTFDQVATPKAELGANVDLSQETVSGRSVVKVTAVVVNTGDAIASTNVLFFIDDHAFFQTSVQLQPGMTKQVITYVFVKGGEHTYSAIVDPGNSYTEKDEANNLAQKTATFSSWTVNPDFVTDPFFLLAVLVMAVAAFALARRSVRRWIIK